MASKLTDLIVKRKKVDAHIKSAQRELEKLDAEILERVGKLADAIEGVAPSQTNKDDEKLWITSTHTTSHSTTAYDLAKLAMTVIVPKKRKPTLEDPIVEILHDAERPLATKEILEVLQKRGIAVNGKRHLNTLSA